MQPFVVKKHVRKSNRPEKIIQKLTKNKEVNVCMSNEKRFINEILIECSNRERLIDEDAINNILNKSSTIGPPFVCIICKQWFLSKEKLLIHYIGNHEKISCHMCLLVFDTIELCTIHENKAHYPLCCEICNDEFIDLQILENHYIVAHNTMACRFCNLLIQPQSCYTTHINRKHNVYDGYNEKENLLIIDQWFDEKWNFRCRMCNKIRPKKDVYGHFRMHHKITANSFVNVIQNEEIQMELNGSIDEVIPIKKPILVDVKTETSDECSMCDHSKKIPFIFHQVYCMKKFACHNCFEIFNDQSQLRIHKEMKHKTFRCALGCENIVSVNERDLEVHYKKFHDVIACKFCEVCVHADHQKYMAHLINEHSVKDLEEVFDTDLLFQETVLNNQKIIVCCLCEQNITDIMQSIDILYAHFNDQHSIMLKTIVSYNQSNPFSTQNIVPKLVLNNEETVSSHDEDDNNKEIEIFQDIDPKYIECSIYDGNVEDDENYGKLLKIKEEPFDDFDDDLIPINESTTNLICELCCLKFCFKNELMEHLHIQHGFNLLLHTCNECFEKFTNENALELHLINIHKINEKEVKCPFCTVVSFKKHVQRHIQIEHIQELKTNVVIPSVGYRCRFCKDMFWKQLNRNEHEIQKHYKFNENHFIRCYVCYEIFSRKYCLRQHVEQSHKQNFDLSRIIYKCLQCCAVLPRLHIIKEHFLSQHSELVIYKCAYDNCTFWNSTKSTVEVHVKENHQKFKVKNITFTPKPCEMCGKHLSSQRSAKIHYRMKHTGERIGFGCRLCSERFDTIEKRKLHYTVVHTGIRAFICSVCGKGFNSKSGLYGHKQLHNNNSFECEYCHKIFVRKDTYSEHILIHSGPRHLCQYCSRSFTQRSNLIRHTRIHTGEKPYQCTMCPKKFSDKGACNSHVRVHTREEVCSCPFCGKTYSKKQKLKYHLKTHTGEDQFGNKQNGDGKTLICSECNEGFSDERYLHRHIITTHVEMACNYKCRICNQKFITQNHLNSHTLSHFGVKHIKCLLCEAAYASNESIIDHLREDHKISNEEVEKYFKQLSSEDVEKLLTTCLEKDTSSVNVVFSDIKPDNIPSPQKYVADRNANTKKTNCNKRRKKALLMNEDEIKLEIDKKPKRYAAETHNVKLTDYKISETVVNVNTFLEVNIKEEIIDEYDSESI